MIDSYEFTLQFVFNDGEMVKRFTKTRGVIIPRIGESVFIAPMAGTVSRINHDLDSNLISVYVDTDGEL